MVKQDGAKEYQGYAIVVGEQDKSKKAEGHLTVRYPTFCKTKMGTRLYASQWIMNSKGQWLTNEKKPARSLGYGKAREALFARLLKKDGVKDPAKDCRTVRLTSKP